METTTEIAVGDKVFLRDSTPNIGNNWDGLRAIVTSLNGTGGYWVKMDEGDKRADGYDAEPFVWNNVEKRDADPDATVLENQRLQERVNTLENAVREANSDKYAARNDLDEFKQKVVKVASEYAIKNDWCSEVTKALEEIGLETSVTRSVRINGTINVDVPICSSTDDLDLEISVGGDSVDLYYMEVEFNE